MDTLPSAPAARDPQPAPAPSLPVHAVLKALAEPARWRLLFFLVDGERRRVAELCHRSGRDSSVVSKQLTLLRKAQLVERDRFGMYRLPAGLQPQRGQPVLDLGFCLLRLDRMEQSLKG